MRRRTWARSAAALLALLALLTCAGAACTALVGVDHDYTLAPPDGTTADAPVTFPADAGAVTKVAAGRFHTCAFFGGSGVAKCWGRNDDYDELGNGTMASTAVPLYAMTPGLTALFVGAHDTCGVRAAGGECAGKGGLGELGDGVVDADSPVPEPMSVLPSAPVDIASGEAFTCAIVTNGDVWCVGNGSLGELGNGSFGISATAVQAQLPSAATQISAFYQHACALLSDGTVACWGDDSTGALGDGNATPDGGVATPAVVQGLPHAIAVGAGEGFSCALVDTGSGAVWCWGDNTYGELGNGSNDPSNVPVQVQGLVQPSLLAVGGEHACAASLEQGGIACWGSGESGQLGDGNGSTSSTPVTVANIGGYPESLTAGGFHTCALVASPVVQCWGSDDFGQLGDGMTNMDEHAPVTVAW